MTAPRGISQPPTSFIGSQMPRHPPCALKHLQHKTKSYKNNSKLHHQHNTKPQPTPKRKHVTPPCAARCSQPLSTNQTPHPTTKAGQQHTNPDTYRGATPTTGTASISGFPHTGRRDDGPVVSKPNSVSDNSSRPTVSPTGVNVCCAPDPHPLQARGHPTNRQVIGDSAQMRAGPGLVVLLRKEVIQPHLPVRLPCYDFVPIADPTFDSSLPQGVRPLASGVTDFHDVTGGVYKARERIHRSVADLRLLATPTSRGRVADPDPN